MADDKLQNGDETPEEEQKKQEEDDSGALTGDSQEGDLGNLPPLSDFESSEGPADEGEEPPEEDSGGISGLPPISDINVETPQPTGGNVRAAPPGYGDQKKEGSDKERPDLDTPFSDSQFDTAGSGGTGFDDLAADSDFTPETPELGGDQDSDMETPMFDSAFGGGSSDFDTPQTSAPTQAMETPMFGESSGSGQGDSGFDADAFGSGDSGDSFGSAFEGGTPVPDFSPDTAAPSQGTPPPVAGPPRTPAAAGAGGGGIGIAGVAIGILLLIIGLAVGAFLGPTLTYNYMPEGPMNPWSDDVSQLETEITSLQGENRQLQREIEVMGQIEDLDLSPEEIEALRVQRDELTEQVEALSEAVNESQQQLAAIEREIELKSEEYVRAEEEYEELLNQTSITLARRDGLLSEVERLQDLVGSLDLADERRIATRDALRHATNQLAVRIREGIPLTPQKFSRQVRIEAVENLKAEIEGRNWVDPMLLDQYTELYLTELEIAEAREYFFAKIPVTDRWGITREIWAECLMNGNWSVYFRTIDGQNIGVFENVAPTGPARYEFRMDVEPVVAAQLETTIIQHRVEDFQEKIMVLADKQVVTERKTGFQQIFDSL